METNFDIKQKLDELTLLSRRVGYYKDLASRNNNNKNFEDKFSFLVLQELELKKTITKKFYNALQGDIV